MPIDHVGPLHSFKTLQLVRIQSRVRSEEFVFEEFASGDGLACEACGLWWFNPDARDTDGCMEFCEHCQHPPEEHADGKCLFGPTRYVRETFTVEIK